MSDLQQQAYIEQHSSRPCETLHDLWRHTWLHTVNPRMAAGPQHGLLLQMICRMLKPAKVLEVGTFTGYAAIAMALATPADSLIISIEADEEHLHMASKYIQKAGVEHKIQLVSGDAREILPKMDDVFDLIYLDADKISYPGYLPDLKRLLPPGGFLLADNVLWGSKVANLEVNDRETAALRQFNQMVSEDEDFEQLILPVHDGLLMARKLF